MCQGSRLWAVSSLDMCQGSRLLTCAPLCRCLCAGEDLLRLTRSDLIQICGVADGIRLDNVLQSRSVRPNLVIYIGQEPESGELFAHDACRSPITDRRPERVECGVGER